ncbi:423_t:CDS:2 [Entrophospora sp. SA101]|nr:3828_t:CDS:2 [Entrophospora sp. SA101]CAJ0766077.1 423_t:CDS:2 [Entrophospora sp. SA101]
MSPELQALSQDQKPKVPALRIVPHIEGSRSLHFNIIEREVPEDVVIKIGRFTDKAHVPNRVAFKSKVVSRGHAEIWCNTKSSSGTFLNHVRLSPPNSESKAFLLNDGDVVQLGVDYQGGTEEGTKQQIVDCCICLGGIGPYQALFLAPCSHVFHYKCIRPTLFSHHSGFLCPLCRSFADLEAAVDNSIDWEQVLAEQEDSSVAEKLQEEVVTQSPNNIVIDNSSADDEEQPFENIEESSTSDKGIQAIIHIV